MTLELASAIVDKTLARARTEGFKPLAVAVLDAAGQLIAFKREDQSSLLRSDIAIGKAWGVLSMGMGGRDLARRAVAQPAFYNSLLAMAGGKLVLGVGGVLVRDAEGVIIGAVGVSGDTSDKDEVCAIAGIEAGGLRADPGAAQ
jgi:uncharacterized protein GlcG (DUF336 family)